MATPLNARQHVLIKNKIAWRKFPLQLKSTKRLTPTSKLKTRHLPTSAMKDLVFVVVSSSLWWQMPRFPLGTQTQVVCMGIVWLGLHMDWILNLFAWLVVLKRGCPLSSSTRSYVWIFWLFQCIKSCPGPEEEISICTVCKIIWYTNHM